MMNQVICNLFNNFENSKIFKRLPAKFSGASNIYVIKMNYNYSNQNEYSYLNGCIFKCDVDAPDATVDDIEILVNVIPGISYSSSAANLDNAITFKYYDGSWFRLYYNKYFESWKIATPQLINGEIATWNGIAIGHIFETYVNEHINLDDLDKTSTYFFIYSHPFVTFDPTVNEEHIQFIAEVNNGLIVDTDSAIFERNNEEIDDKCNFAQMTENGINMVVQNELYQQIKQQFRVDLNTVFLNFYAKPNENMHSMKMFFDLCPRFVEPYNEFIKNPMLEALVRTIVDFTQRNICRYVNRMNIKVSKLDTPIFKIWCSMLSRIDPMYKWDHNSTPFYNLKMMNPRMVEKLTNMTCVREMLCDIPINDLMAVL